MDSVTAIFVQYFFIRSRFTIASIPEIIADHLGYRGVEISNRSNALNKHQTPHKA